MPMFRILPASPEGIAGSSRGTMWPAPPAGMSAVALHASCDPVRPVVNDRAEGKKDPEGPWRVVDGEW